MIPVRSLAGLMFWQIDSLKTRLLLAEQKLQLFEEYNEDIFYDFDQVAAAMKIYRQPPLEQVI